MIYLSQYPILKDDLTAGVTNAEYLITINSGSTEHGNINIGTKKQMFAGNFYEDRDLKVSRITEKINIKTKKVQLSSVNITLTNFPTSTNNEDRLSNNPALAIGAYINVWLKTQSCQSVHDCIRVARLKITRIEHDEKKIKINADDISLQAFSQNLPQDKYVLKQGVNTFEHYDSNPVPILYGNLDAAPATIYVDKMNWYLYGEAVYSSNSIKVLVDTSYLNPNTTKICGIKSLGFMGHVNGADTNSPTNWSYSEGGGEIIYGKFLTDNDTLKIGIDDQFCSVLAVPSWNTSYALMESWNQMEVGSQFGIENIYAHPQYIVDEYGLEAFYDDSAVSMNSISLITKTYAGTYPSKYTLLTKGAIWVNHFANHISKDAMILNSIVELNWDAEVKNYYHDVVLNQVEFGEDYTQFLNIHTSANFGTEGGEIDGAFTFQDQKSNLAIETLEFESLSGADVYSVIDGEGNDEHHPSEVSFVGKHKLVSEKGDLFDSVGNMYEHPEDSATVTAAHISVFGFPSGYTKDNDAHGSNSFSDDQIWWENDIITTSTEMGYPQEVEKHLNNFIYDASFLYDHLDFNLGFDEQLHEKLSSTGGIGNLPITPFYFMQRSGINEGGTHTSIQSFLYGDLFYDAAISTGDYKPFGYYSDLNSPEGSADDYYYSDFSPMNATQISFYMMNNPNGGLIGDANIKSYWEDVKLKKAWAENNAFSKDFFVSAKGKKTDNISWYSSFDDNYYPTKRVSGIIEVLWAMEDSDDTSATLGMQRAHNNAHFEKLHKILTSKKLKTKVIGGKLYERMLMSQTEMTDGTITKSYLYDIELNNFGLSYGKNGNGSSLLVGQPPGGTYVEYGDGSSTEILHDIGWDIRFSAYLFGHTPVISSTVQGAFAGVRLVWGRKNYATTEDGNNYIHSITESIEQSGDFEKFNEANGCGINAVSNFYGEGDLARTGYTMAYWNSSNTPHQNLAENPASIIKDLVANELQVPLDFDQNKYGSAFNAEQNNKFAFSINKTTPAKEIVEKICEQSRLFFRYRASDGSPILDCIKNTYSNGDVDKLIDSDMILKYQFSKTKIEDLCFGGVSVRYAYNYLTKEYDGIVLKKVLETDVTAFKDLYSIDNHEDYMLEVEAPYIQDEATATILRNYLYELYKNQHLTCKLTLPLKEGIEVEVGDIVRFSKDPHGVKPFGKTVTSSHSIGGTGQKALPYFMVTSASKSLTEVSLELYQFNEIKIITLNPTLLGDINENGWVNETDYELLLNYLNGEDIEISEQGLANADIDGDGFITESDLNALADLIEQYGNTGEYDEDMMGDPDTPWDVNGDGNITTDDFEAIWQYVVSNNSGTVDPPNVAWMTNADADNDGVVSWQDYILGLDTHLAVAGQIDKSSGVPGDIDGDGFLTAADLTYLQNHLQEDGGWIIQEGNPHYINLPDFDNDGVTDWEDYDILLAEYNNINGEFFQVPGDLTMNGEVNIRDIIYHIKIFDGVVTPTDTQVLNGDLNGNGFIDTMATSGLPHDLIAFLLGQFENGINYCTTNEYQEGFINGALLTQDDFDKIQEYTGGSYLDGLGLEAFVNWYKNFHSTDYEITIQDYVNLCGANNIDNIGVFPTSQLSRLQELIDSDEGESESDPDTPPGYFELASTSYGTDLELGQASLSSVTLGKYTLDSSFDIEAINFKFDTDYTATSDDHVFAPSATWQSLYVKIYYNGSHSLGTHSSSSGHEERTDLIIRTSFIGSDEDLTFVQNYQNGQRWDVCQAFLALDGMTVRNCRIQPSGGLLFFRLEADTISHPDGFNWTEGSDESFSLGGVEYNYEVNDKIPSELAMFFKIDIYAPENYWLV